MAHIVIVGAGIGGLPAAYEARELLGESHQITLINESRDFRFVPSNPWIAVGWRGPQQVSFDLHDILSRKNIEFVAQRVEIITATENNVTLADGSKVEYDYLIITTGPELAFDAIEGVGPAHHTHSICTLPHAQQCYLDVQKLIAQPGPVVIGAVQGASCFGPAYEYAFILDKALRDEKIRDQVPITFVTSEPYIGHLGLGGVGDSKSMLESAMRSKHIKWITNAKVNKVVPGSMQVDALTDTGELQQHHDLPFKHAMLLPSFRGVPAVANVPELCNEKGFVKIDQWQRSPTYNNIYSAGVCVAIPPVEKTPVPIGTPKTGFMIESMVTALVHNIQADLNGESPHSQATWNAICLADMGDTGAAFVAIPQIPPRNVTWFKQGKWVHLAKIGFEKYFMHKMKTGSTDPFYERWVFSALGLDKLKDEKH
ncbi:MAG: sulfide:quinone oxidoreductase [Paraglaciecola sp.]|jgi:sulfide:quinone oxidoreductase